MMGLRDIMMDYLVHIANIFLLISFSVKSILLLRALNIVAGSFFITWAFLAETPIWSMIGWNTLFAVINIRQIWLAILERRPPKLNAEEQELHRSIFAELSPKSFRLLLDIGQWENGVPPTVLVNSGQTPDRLWMVTEGRIEVTKDGQQIRVIEAGNFVGEGSFLANTSMKADVMISQDVRFLSWSRESLSQFMEDSPIAGAVMQKIFGKSLVKKLEESQSNKITSLESQAQY